MMTGRLQALARGAGDAPEPYLKRKRVDPSRHTNATLQFKIQLFFSNTKTQSAKVGVMGAGHAPVESGATSPRSCCFPDAGSK